MLSIIVFWYPYVIHHFWHPYVILVFWYPCTISHNIDSLCLAFQTTSIEFFSAEGMDKSEVERQLKLMNSQDTHSPSFFSKFIELQVGK